MYKGSRSLSVLVLALFGAMALGQLNEFVPGEVIVKFKSTSMNTSRVNPAHAAIRATVKRTIPRLGVQTARIPNGMQVMDAVAYYRSLPSVQYAEPNFKGKYHYTPNDPRFGQQYGPTIIKAPEAWDITKGDASVIIAILDSGFEMNHQDMVGKFTAGWDFEDNDSDPGWDGEVNHGIHVAGIAGAATDNAIGIAASGFDCRIMPLRLGSVPTSNASAAALIFAADNGAKVASMSYGRNIESSVERDAINYAWSRGLVLLASSGNDGTQNQSWPAAFANVIAVGATNAADQRAGFSTWGPWVSVGAPGVAIWSHVENNGYEAWDGTSMACPMAAGVVGLMWSIALPGTTNLQIRQALESTTDPISNGGFANGRINALRACEALDPGSATISPVNDVSLWHGAGHSGSASDLHESDSNFVSVTSVPSSIGHVASANVDITFNGGTENLREAFAFIEGNAPMGVTGQLYLWNYTSNKFVLIKAFALRPSGVKRERIMLPKNLTAYVSGGNMRMGIRGLGPKRAPRDWPHGTFDLQLGFVEVATREPIIN